MNGSGIITMIRYRRQSRFKDFGGPWHKP